MKRVLAMTVAIAALSAPAYAAGMYYVSQDAKSKACTVTETKPDGKAQMQMGDKGFATKVLAEAAMKTDKGCK
jgi:hypothetical protein